MTDFEKICLLIDDLDAACAPVTLRTLTERGQCPQTTAHAAMQARRPVLFGPRVRIENFTPSAFEQAQTEGITLERGGYRTEWRCRWQVKCKGVLYDPGAGWYIFADVTRMDGRPSTPNEIWATGITFLDAIESLRKQLRGDRHAP